MIINKNTPHWKIIFTSWWHLITHAFIPMAIISSLFGIGSYINISTTHDHLQEIIELNEKDRLEGSHEYDNNEDGLQHEEITISDHDLKELATSAPWIFSVIIQFLGFCLIQSVGIDFITSLLRKDAKTRSEYTLTIFLSELNTKETITRYSRIMIFYISIFFLSGFSFIILIPILASSSLIMATIGIFITITTLSLMFLFIITIPIIISVNNLPLFAAITMAWSEIKGNWPRTLAYGTSILLAVTIILSIAATILLNIATPTHDLHANQEPYGTIPSIINTMKLIMIVNMLTLGFYTVRSFHKSEYSP